MWAMTLWRVIPSTIAIHALFTASAKVVSESFKFDGKPTLVCAGSINVSQRRLQCLNSPINSIPVFN